MKQRVLANSDILEVELAAPPGHQHLRAVLRLRNHEELVLQEATLANLVRAYVTVKTHPTLRGVQLVGRKLRQENIKEGFAVWQLLEKE